MKKIGWVAILCLPWLLWAAPARANGPFLQMGQSFVSNLWQVTGGGCINVFANCCDGCGCLSGCGGCGNIPWGQPLTDPWATTWYLQWPASAQMYSMPSAPNFPFWPTAGGAAGTPYGVAYGPAAQLRPVGYYPQAPTYWYGR
jgi:hypothetical protein